MFATLRDGFLRETCISQIDFMEKNFQAGVGRRERVEWGRKKCKVKNPTTAGFEPARETPRDFESLALTTRPNCHS